MATTILLPADLDNIRSNLAGDYVLGADIDLTSFANWVPIGTLATPFTGSLTGTGYTISNLAISRATEDYVGLFGYCNFNNKAVPSLVGVSIAAANVAGKDNVGALAGCIVTNMPTGYVDDDTINPKWGFDIILGCGSAGVVNGANNVGGLLGSCVGPLFAGWRLSPNDSNVFVEEGVIARIKKCLSSTAVTGSGVNIGGLIGYTHEVRPTYSRASGVVTGGDWVGGLVGYAYRTYTDWSYALGNVTGEKAVGGLIGVGDYRISTKQCYAEGNVEQVGTFDAPEAWSLEKIGVGGLVGWGDIDFVDNCYAKGNVTGKYRAGGLFGTLTEGGTAATNMEDVYARGDVSAISIAGGLIGFLFPYIFEIDQAYCAGSVAGTIRGAIIGQRACFNSNDLYGKVTIRSKLFYNLDVNTASTQHGGDGLSAAAMSLDATYETEWGNFDKHWILDPDDDIYPQLLEFYDPMGLTIAALKGFTDGTTDQGLVLAYTVEGKVYYRSYDGAAWGAETQVTELPEPANTLNLSPTRDGRVAFITDVSDVLYMALTDAYLLTIERVITLPYGSYGNLAHLSDDTLRLSFVNAAQSMSESQTELESGDWSTVEFGNITCLLSSDSYISRLRAKLLGGLAWYVWRSRTQHRILQREESEQVVETLDVPEGSITLRQDTPVVPCSLELFNFERVTGEGGGGTTTSEIGYQEITQQAEVPSGYTGIYDVADLLAVANNMAGNYIQMADIDLTEHEAWTALTGPPNGLLEGIYDGNGYEITGLTGNGLFVGTHNNYTPGLTGEIKNVKIINADTSGNGAIISDYHEGIITNCYVSGNACISVGNCGGGIISYCTANVNIVSDNYETGAICGGNYGSSEIKYCCSSGSIINSRSGSVVGGLIAYNGDVTTSVHDCYSTCSIIALNAAQVGGLIGYNGSDAAATNCYAAGNVITDGGNVGGLIGYNDSAYAIVNCHATGNVTCEDGSYAGGLVGYSADSLTNCYATGNVTCEDGSYAGGLVGYSADSLTNCYATGNVTCEDGSYAGGFAGTIEANITNCYATGNVIGNAEYAGGFAAYFGDYSSPPTISKCFAAGNVKGARYASGFVGLGWYGNVDNCYAFGSAEATVTADDYGAVGGFLGEGDLQIANCYSVGLVTGVGDNVGGFIGWENFIAGGGTATNCFYNSETSGQSDTSKGTPKTTAEMLLEATYTDWDFVATWKLSSITKGYPALQWQLGSNEPLANYPPASYIQLQFTAGDSDPYSMGKYYVDRMNCKAGDPMVSVEARNSIGKYLKDQSFDERGSFSTATLTSLFTQIMASFGITNYYIGTSTKQLSIQFSPSQAVLDGITDLLKFAADWVIRENADGKIVIADRDDAEHTQPGKYTFYRNRDIFSREQTKDDSTCYGRVCVHDSSFNIMVFRPVSYTLSWLPPAQKTYYVSMPDGITNADATALATEIADQLSNSGEVETFVGPFRPHLLPGDEAEIMDADGPTLLGVVTTVQHDFGKSGFITTLTIDSGGKIGKPMLSDYLSEIANRISNKNKTSITY